MPQVDYLPIANGPSADVESQAQYEIDLGGGGTLENGYITGIAQTQQVNKTWRQSSVMTAAIANALANRLDVDILDDGDVGALTAYIEAAFDSTALNMAALQTANIVEGVALFLMGYYTAGDGGGGYFEWDASSSATANNGTVVAKTGHVGNGRWLRIMTNGPSWVSVLWFGAGVGQANTVNYASISAAIANVSPAGSRSIYVPAGNSPYLTSGVFSLTAAKCLYTDSFGQNSSLATTFKYTGASTASAVLTIVNGAHGAGIDGIKVDANNLADIGYAVLVNTSSSTQQPFMKNVFSINYRTRGYVLGADNIVTVNDGAFEQIKLERIGLGGPGAAGANTAIGIVYNAQNSEMANIDQIYIQPSSGFNNLNHIYALAGGMHIQNYASTGAFGYGITVSGSQFICDSLRTEDSLVIEFLAVQAEGPHELREVLSRGTGVTPSDPIIYFHGSGDSQLLLGNCKLNGSVQIGPTANIRVTGVMEFGAGADFILQSPENSAYDIFKTATAERQLRGRFQMHLNDLAFVAHAGGGQGSATQMLTPVIAIGTCATDHDSIKLLADHADLMVIYNATAKICDLYPQTGGSINALGTNNPFPLGAGKSVWIMGTAANFYIVTLTG